MPLLLIVEIILTAKVATITTLQRICSPTSSPWILGSYCPPPQGWPDASDTDSDSSVGRPEDMPPAPVHPGLRPAEEEEVEGLPGAPYRGFGRCFKCSKCPLSSPLLTSPHSPPSSDRSGHWAPGCPF